MGAVVAINCILGQDSPIMLQGQYPPLASGVPMGRPGTVAFPPSTISVLFSSPYFRPVVASPLVLNWWRPLVVSFLELDFWLPSLRAMSPLPTLTLTPTIGIVVPS